MVFERNVQQQSFYNGGYTVVKLWLDSPSHIFHSCLFMSILELPPPEGSHFIELVVQVKSLGQVITGNTTQVLL